MNRRQFFGMTATAVVAAGLPSIVLPEKTIFLPPMGGWFRTPLVMREVRQYLINNDTMPMRYDAAWLDSKGERQQYWVSFEDDGTDLLLPSNAERLRFMRTEARSILEEFRRRAGLSNQQQDHLKIPRGIDHAIILEA